MTTSPSEPNPRGRDIVTLGDLKAFMEKDVNARLDEMERKIDELAKSIAERDRTAGDA